MKSVIAQGSSIVKAVEEALKKAGQPSEFFVKLLEDAQGGFLGFGAKKAKIALFFKQNNQHHKIDGLLSQNSYQDLFENNHISKQIEEQLKNTNVPKEQPRQQAKPQQQQQQQPKQHHPRPTPHQQQKHPKPQPKVNQPKPQTQQPKSQPQAQPQQVDKKNIKPIQPKEKSNQPKMMVRPLPNKNNDSSKS